MSENFEISAAAELSDLTSGMVDYLCRTDVITPSVKGQRGRGKRRQYTFGDVVMLRAVSHLLKAGVAVSKLKKALNTLKKHHPQITPNSLPKQYIVTDGKEVFLRHGNDVLECLDDGQFAFAFVIKVSKVRNEVLTKLQYDSAA